MTTSNEADEALWTYAEAAKYLGISERTLERYVREHRVPYVQFPQRGSRRTLVRFLRTQLVRWLEQRTVRPRRMRDDVNQGTA